MLPACLSKAPIPHSLRKLGITAEDRNQYSVGNKHFATDGNDATFANAAFWGAGQGLRINLPTNTRIGAARLVAEVYEGPGFGSCNMSFGGVTLTVGLGQGKQERLWFGDVVASQIDVPEYARTRIYEVEVWEKVVEPAIPPKVIWPVVEVPEPEPEPTPYEIAEQQSLERVDSGPSKVDELLTQIAVNNHTQSFNYVNQSIEFWQNTQLQDPGNGDTQGTLGYYAVSARDFWSDIGNAYDEGAPPPVIVDLLNTWKWYASEQIGKPQNERTPIDIWYENKKNA